MIKEQFTQNKAGWKRSFLEGFSQDANGAALPWMTYPAIEFLQKSIRPHHEIFEFGCGASTLFFASRVRKVTSLETNKRWLELIKEKLPTKNVEITLMEDGLENDLYQNFAKDCGQKFDFIIIDSLKRFQCAKNSITALKPNGTIILDDSERKNYQKIFDFLATQNFIALDFIGIEPGRLRVKKTTIFQKS